MPPKQSPAPRPKITPLTKSLTQREDVKASEKSKDKDKDKPRVKVYDKGHKHSNSYDTGYASGLSSPWNIEERSPDDYTTAVPKSAKPRSEKEPYEIITSSSRPRYIKADSERKKDVSPLMERKKDIPATAERKKDVRYINRSPDSLDVDDDYVPGPSTDTRKDKYAGPRRTTLVLQTQLAKNTDDLDDLSEDDYDDSQIQRMEAELRKVRLERQIAEGRTSEAKPKQQHLEDLNVREKQVQQKLAEEQKKRVKFMTPREEELAEKQWKEIQAIPNPKANPSLRRSATNASEPTPPSRRHTLMTPYGSTALTTATQSPSVLATENPFLAPILEAQREEDARRAAREEKRRGTAIKETGRTARQRPRNDDRYI